MSYWEAGNRGRRFRFGEDAPAMAAAAAEECGQFVRDDDDECFFEESVTCYNCRYRRWTPNSFECLKREDP